MDLENSQNSSVRSLGTENRETAIKDPQITMEKVEELQVPPIETSHLLAGQGDAEVPPPKGGKDVGESTTVVWSTAMVL